MAATEEKMSTLLLNANEEELEKCVETVLDYDKSLRTLSEQIFIFRSSLSGQEFPSFGWYSRLAEFAASVWSVVVRLETIQGFYQFSQGWFMEQCKTLLATIPVDNYKKREVNGKTFLRNVFKIVSPTLLERHRTIFGFLLATKFAAMAQLNPQLAVSDLEISCLLEEPDAIKTPPANPATNYLFEEGWCQLYNLTSHQPVFDGLIDHFNKYARKASTPLNELSWEDIYRSAEPHKVPFPSVWEDKLTLFQRILVIKCLRPDSLSFCLEYYIEEAIGINMLESVVDPIPYLFRLTSAQSPIALFSITDDNPVDILRRVAAARSMLNFLVFHNLGDESCGIFDTVFMDAITKGKWLVLKNAHLFVGKLAEVEIKMRSLKTSGLLAANLNPQFRLWLIAEPREDFPSYFLRNSVKICYERGSPLKVNLWDEFVAMEENLTPHEFKPSPTYKTMLYNLILVHVCLRRRAAYGRLTYNSSYTFSYDDLIVATRKLRDIFHEADGNMSNKVAVTKIMSLVVPSSFASQVVDEIDLSVLKTLVHDFMTVDWNSSSIGVMGDIQGFKEIYNYINNKGGTIKSAYDVIGNLSRLLPPTVYGLDNNGATYRHRRISISIVHAMRAMGIFKSEQTASYVTRCEHVYSRLQEMRTQLVTATKSVVLGKVITKALRPKSLQISAITGAVDSELEFTNKFKYLDLCLDNNVIQYQRLVKYLVESMQIFSENISNENAWTRPMQVFVNDFYDNRVPRVWTESGFLYPSIFKLKVWFDNLMVRLEHLKSWYSCRYIELKPMVCYDLGMTFNAEQFVHAVVYDYAVLHRVASDNVSVDVVVFATKPVHAPERGVYVTGLNLMSATWDFTKYNLKEEKHLETYFNLPCVRYFYSRV